VDCLSLGAEVYRMVPNLVFLYYLPYPVTDIYFGSQFAPLIIFFLMYLCIVRNRRVPHFVRFHAMQAIMLDIICMLAEILRTYLPAEIRWSVLLDVFDKYAYMSIMIPVIYSMICCLRGEYAEIPGISNSVYVQIQNPDAG